MAISLMPSAILRNHDDISTSDNGEISAGALLSPHGYACAFSTPFYFLHCTTVCAVIPPNSQRHPASPQPGSPSQAGSAFRDPHLGKNEHERKQTGSQDQTSHLAD